LVIILLKQFIASPLRHIAIIMDGNNRWAKQRNLSGLAGHKAGVERLRDMLEECRHNGVDVLTVFAFSSENWQRPAAEVRGLMSLFQQYLGSEAKRLKKENVRLRVIGDRKNFDKKLIEAIEKAEALTANGKQTFNIAADYGGRWDVVNAAKHIAESVQSGLCNIEDIDESLFNSHTALADLPAVDLLIRTGGESRVSNFLLWQLAYSELYFSDRLWPDFDREALTLAIQEFTCRERRFGFTSEQIIGQIDDVLNNNNKKGFNCD
jgi:undecaprenyl diphosphate synthase